MADAKRLYRALMGVAREADDGPCWCDMAVGGPLAKSHSRACQEARTAIRLDDIERLGFEVVMDPRRRRASA